MKEKFYPLDATMAVLYFQREGIRSKGHSSNMSVTWIGDLKSVTHRRVTLSLIPSQRSSELMYWGLARRPFASHSDLKWWKADASILDRSDNPATLACRSMFPQADSVGRAKTQK